MTRDEVVRAVREAQRAIAAYRQQEFKTAVLTEQQRRDVDELRRAGRELLNEMQRSYMMGPAGNPCGCCNGTGRV